MRKKGRKLISAIFLFTNIIAVMSIIVFVYYTIQRICFDNQAREFIGKVKSLPQNPAVKIWQVFFLLIILCIDMFIREYKQDEKGKPVLFTLALDFICCMLIVFILDFNYNGILLFVFANLIVYIKNRKIKYLLIGIAMLSYLVADYELLSLYRRVYSVRDYVQFYSIEQQQQIFCVYQALSSINVMIFILYCIKIINEQKDTIEEANKLSKQLKEANEKLKEYNKMTERMIETRERNRVAREIHDTLGHTLTGVSVGVDACIALVDIDITKTKKQLGIIARLVRDGIKEVRRSVSELRADSLEHFQLDKAIEDMIREINSLSGVEVLFHSEASPLKFSEDEENVIYRIIQEGITNAIRHGKSTKIYINIKKKEGFLYLQIQDNGCGCSNIQKGFGIKHMKERVNMLGGSIVFSGEKGFLIDAKIPIRWGKEYD